MSIVMATRPWIFLIVLTLFSYGLSMRGYTGQVFVLIVLATALLKGQMIIDHFMMLKSAPLMWRIIITMWLLTVIAVISAMYSAAG
jgi:Prokaryotic Cytochrome C oxidase subunit IV